MSKKNKKLRLLVTKQCQHKCPMCCNNQFDLMKVPVVDRIDYDEIMITGGEPLLYPLSVRELIQGLRVLRHGTQTKFYVYTSIAHPATFPMVLDEADGIVLTPHNKGTIDLFCLLNAKLLRATEKTKGKSLRLCLFPDIKAMLPQGIDLSLWQVKDIEWKKDCPLPDGEDFRRLPNLIE